MVWFAEYMSVARVQNLGPSPVSLNGYRTRGLSVQGRHIEAQDRVFPVYDSESAALLIGRNVDYVFRNDDLIAEKLPLRLDVGDVVRVGLGTEVFAGFDPELDVERAQAAAMAALWESTVVADFGGGLTREAPVEHPRPMAGWSIEMFPLPTTWRDCPSGYAAYELPYYSPGFSPQPS